MFGRDSSTSITTLVSNKRYSPCNVHVQPIFAEYMEFEIWDEDPRFLGPGLLTSSDDKKPECSELSFVFLVIPHLFYPIKDDPIRPLNMCHLYV